MSEIEFGPHLYTETLRKTLVNCATGVAGQFDNISNTPDGFTGIEYIPLGKSQALAKVLMGHVEAILGVDPISYYTPENYQNFNYELYTGGSSSSWDLIKSLNENRKKVVLLDDHYRGFSVFPSKGGHMFKNRKKHRIMHDDLQMVGFGVKRKGLAYKWRYPGTFVGARLSAGKFEELKTFSHAVSSAGGFLSFSDARARSLQGEYGEKFRENRENAQVFMNTLSSFI